MHQHNCSLGNSQISLNLFTSFDPLCSLASYYLTYRDKLAKQFKAEHCEGTQLILELLLSVRVAAWEFGLSRLGKWFSVFRQQSVMMELWWLEVRISTYSIISNPFQYIYIAQLSYNIGDMVNLLHLSFRDTPKSSMPHYCIVDQERSTETDQKKDLGFYIALFLLPFSPLIPIFLTFLYLLIHLSRLLTPYLPALHALVSLAVIIYSQAAPLFIPSSLPVPLSLHFSLIMAASAQESAAIHSKQQVMD